MSSRLEGSPSSRAYERRATTDCTGQPQCRECSWEYSKAARLMLTSPALAIHAPRVELPRQKCNGNCSSSLVSASQVGFLSKQARYLLQPKCDRGTGFTLTTFMLMLSSLSVWNGSTSTADQCNPLGLAHRLYRVIEP